MHDPDLREILKEISRFSSYPQMFIDKKFVGGLNFLRNAHNHGGLTSVIPSTEVMLPMRQKIVELISKQRIMLFIEGTIDFPTEINSEKLVNIVRDPRYNYARENLDSFDLNQDREIRPALLDYCQYRVTPQLYIGQRLVGGLEIVRELHQQGKLKDLLEYVPPKRLESLGDKYRSKFKSSKHTIL